MTRFVQKICDGVVEQNAADKNVLGILLFGSAARNKFDEYSDVDIYILLNKKGKFTRSNFIRDGVRVDIIFNTVAEARNYLEKEKNNLRRVTSHMLAYGKILFRRGKNLKKIQAVAKNNLKLKTKYKKGEILMHKYSIDDFWGEIQRDIGNKDYLAFGIDSHLLIANIMELFLKLKGAFLKQPNEMRKILERSDKKFSGQIESFYKASNLKDKRKILSILVNRIYKKSGGVLPEKWSLKE